MMLLVVSTTHGHLLGDKFAQFVKHCFPPAFEKCDAVSIHQNETRGKTFDTLGKMPLES